MPKTVVLKVHGLAFNIETKPNMLCTIYEVPKSHTFKTTALPISARPVYCTHRWVYSQYGGCKWAC